MANKANNKLQINWLSPDDLFSDTPITIYDHLPYQPDSEICNADHIELESGNLYKYYTCKESDTPIVIANHDEELELYQELQEASDPV